MDDVRYKQLMEDRSLELTDEERQEGWYFCMGEWDGLLMLHSWEEARYCRGCLLCPSYYKMKQAQKDLKP